MTEPQAWRDRFAELGALWRHDGHPERPYAEYTTKTADGRRRISDGYFNSAVVQQHSRVFAHACTALARILRGRLIAFPDVRQSYVVGAEKGGIALSQRIAEVANFGSAYAEKQPDGSLAFERFSFRPRSMFLLVEDAVTSGATALKLAAAVRKAVPEGALFFPFILTLWNGGELRSLADPASRKEVGPFRIVALAQESARVWAEGENPFTPDGRELVTPVRPKTHWHELTRAYA